MTPNPRLAGRYAKSLLDLSIEKDQLEAVYKDMLFLQAVCTGSRELVSILKSPVIKADKKDKILDAVTAGKIGVIPATFNKLLIRKGREAYLPEIVTAFIQQYKDLKGIHTVKLTTAIAVSDDLKKVILEKIRSATDMQKLELNSEVREDLIGGFILEIGDQLIDTSVAFDLNNIRKQFKNNDFIYKIR
jgi:F-type H+-transporting ATPase subunit delta